MRAAAPWQQIKFGHPERSLEQAPGRQCLVRVRSIIENESAKRTPDQIDFFSGGRGGGRLKEKVMDFCLSLRGPFAMCIFPFEEGIATGQTAQDLYTIFFSRYETHFLLHIKNTRFILFHGGRGAELEYSNALQRRFLLFATASCCMESRGCTKGSHYLSDGDLENRRWEGILQEELIKMHSYVDVPPFYYLQLISSFLPPRWIPVTAKEHQIAKQRSNHFAVLCYFGQTAGIIRNTGTVYSSCACKIHIMFTGEKKAVLYKAIYMDSKSQSKQKCFIQNHILSHLVLKYARVRG